MNALAVLVTPQGVVNQYQWSTMKNISVSSLQQQERNCTHQFFMLTADVRNKLLETNLTTDEWRIWCYLVSLDPFGDRGVFLLQIARQSVEPLRARGQVKQPSEFGWTLDFVKRMYPNNWQEAAQYFGVEVEA
ncbi:MAG: hypothetical protein KME60_00335 [Cyanomargarita calcarea GSE-NOS-MK-12-04C]|jgi:hypothetical protein|uniref:Uncharacterized protein n=1 Tax=Cyanomargarita calcarea GSE-NOS-MK-12-04C TaxID=2839659 RepID=A0A951UQE7_9CYAN|nr:hypothetical protein [Cyanomargarita calcarea GSE-NOS-MK-12-04C]